MRRTLFAVEDLLSSKAPIKDQPYFKFLKSLPTKNGIVEYIQSIIDYLGPRGFEIKKHVLSPEVIEIFRFCHQAYVSGWMPITTPFSLDELFEQTYMKPSEYSYQNKDIQNLQGFRISFKPGYYHIKPQLVSLLENRGLVYALNRYNYYFQVRGNKLYIYYQFILGSRLVCNLKD